MGRFGRGVLQTCHAPCIQTPCFLRPTAAQEVANTVLSAFVLLELGVKLAAMGPRLYWRSNWHKVGRWGRRG